MFYPHTRILLVGAHPDDIELGCGGTIAKLGINVETWCLVLSDRMETQSPREMDEMYRSLHMLGISKECIRTAGIPTRLFTDHRPAIREALLNAGRHFLPQVVFCPCAGDLHQDHRVVYEEASRIFRKESLLGYEIIRSSLNFHPHLYIWLEPVHLRNKIAALKNYRSQTEGRQSAGYYFHPRVIRAWATFRGAHAEVPYAEAFEVYRLKL